MADGKSVVLTLTLNVLMAQLVRASLLDMCRPERLRFRYRLTRCFCQLPCVQCYCLLITSSSGHTWGVYTLISRVWHTGCAVNRSTSSAALWTWLRRQLISLAPRRRPHLTCCHLLFRHVVKQHIRISVAQRVTL